MKSIWAVVAACLLALPAPAAEFDIYQSDFKPLQLALLVRMADDPEHLAERVDRIVRNDLESSQSFSAIDPMAYLVSPGQAWQGIDYGDWRLIGTDVLAFVELARDESGRRLRARLTVHDPFRGERIAEREVEAPDHRPRLLAHRVADRIYEAALGIPGYFTSHILFVAKRGEFSDLIYMDQDGANRQVVGRNFTLLLSPDWSPDGRRVALNTYVGNHPRLEFFDLATGRREVFGDFKGLNSTPEFSPDGRFVAATLSHTGNIDIYIYDLKQRRWSRFTRHPAIETTPTWSPDGKQIAFVSNRTGHPQVYRKPVAGGPAVLVSTQGPYNTSPAWSPLGDRIAMISQKAWEYAVATVRVDGSDIRYLATGRRVESPCWSPNGQMILFSAEENRIRRLYRVPSWGGRAEPITEPTIDASDPAWSRQPPGR